VPLETIDQIRVVAVASILDEHGPIDTVLIHVIQQGLHWLVFEQASVAVRVDDHG
jgi:hypothetical protein